MAIDSVDSAMANLVAGTDVGPIRLTDAQLRMLAEYWNAVDKFVSSSAMKRPSTCCDGFCSFEQGHECQRCKSSCCCYR